ncbi:hypothetical protein Clacol_006498 [Clathrus columnatus]|uniref:Large ribosomal subunit protein mL49 n=1 Tax=Clathrus columnatus TaxID=1419009 RepID=A0AAV5AC84_9AGAM|nr:hypothetical protein Clacol_006498 [Clathrus columnatus]
MRVLRSSKNAIQTAARLAPLKQQSQPPYALIRNSRGSLPVYSDIRNAGTRYQVQIRNILGDTSALLNDLRASLFPPDSVEAAHLKGQIVRSRHIVLQGRGSHWKPQVVEWFMSRGF